MGSLAILGGRQLLRWIPLIWIARAAALVMTALGPLFAGLLADAPRSYPGAFTSAKR